MSLQYVKSQKGRDQLLYKGYLHKKERTSGDKILWKCADYHMHRCTGRAHTRSGRIIKYVPHMHPPNKREEETDHGVCETENNISGQESVQKAVTANRDALSGTATHKKPRLQNNPKQTIQRLRACLNATRQSTSDTRTPAAIAGTTVEGLPLPPTLPSGLQEPSASSGGSVATPILCPELEAANASHLTLNQASQEASRQRFRSGTILLGEAPRQILSQMSEAAHQWLRPQEHNKEQIVDLVILEQFLDVLPTETQIWVRSREPGSSKEAAELAEAYVREQRPADCSVQEELTFEDVSLHFTAEEWALLDNRQKTLYWNVMHQNYDNVAFLAGGRIDGLSEGEAPQHEIPATVVVLSEMNDEKLSQGSEISLVKKDCLNRQQKNSSGEEGKAINVRKGLRELDGDTVINLNTELGVQTRCISPDCEKPWESLILLESQESPSKEDPKSIVLSGELFHITERDHSKNPEVKNQERQNSVEKQQPICVGNEEKCILSRSPLLQAHYVCTDNAEQVVSLRLVNNHNTLSGEDVEEEEGVFQSNEQGMSLDDVPVCSVLSSADLDGTANLIRENQNVLTSHEGNSLGNKAEQKKPIVFANSTEEPIREMHYPSAQLSPVAQGACANSEDQAESLEHTDSQKINHGEELYTCPKCVRPFPQNSNPATQHNCSDPGNSGGLPTSIKHRKVVRKGKYFKGRNTHIKSILGAHQRIQTSRKLWKLWEDWGCYRQSGCRLLKSGKVPRETLRQNTLKSSSQNCEAQHLTTEPVKTCSTSDSNPKHLEPQQRSSTPPHLGSTAAEPVLVHLITLLQQVAADTAEIKSAVSSLHTTITGIHNAIGSVSGCTDEAEHRISNLEDTSRNTRAQLVQHCSDIKAIEAKLVGKGIQHNVIAGLWSSLKINRGASPLNLSPNS